VKDFWKKLKKPILALAPMAGITDPSFRYLCGKYGADVVYSEMVSATAMFHGSQKTFRLMESYKKNGKAKFVVQLFGANPKHFAYAVKEIEKRVKPDGIDINFGCPVPKIHKAGAGAKLFQDLELSHDVIKACVDNTKLPISVKVRVKAGKVSVLDFIEKMKDLPIACLMVHGRTLAQGFAGPADLVALERARKKFGGVFLANGGIFDAASAEEMLKKTGADGLGIGQGACGRPWIFKQLRIKDYELRIAEIFKIALEHAKMMYKEKGDQGLLEMRKHLCWYVKGLPDVSMLRKDLSRVDRIDDIRRIFKDYLAYHKKP
jgi:nifR3 family TIM-barrel protein